MGGQLDEQASLEEPFESQQTLVPAEGVSDDDGGSDQAGLTASFLDVPALEDRYQSRTVEQRSEDAVAVGPGEYQPWDDRAQPTAEIGADQEGSLKGAPPYNADAEGALLGALLYNVPTDHLDELLGGLLARDFYIHANARIFESILLLAKEVNQLDLVTVANHLQQRNLLDKVGGSSYLALLTTNVIGNANLYHYAQILRGLSLKRQILALSRAMQGMVDDHSLKPTQILESCERQILEISDRTCNQHDFYSAADVVHSTIDNIGERYQQKGEISGIPSGITQLDHYTLGFHNAEMVILGARPSVGKTAFALTLAAHIVSDYRIPCGFFTLEMNAMSLMNRILSAEARVDSRLLRSGLLSRADWARLTQAAERVYETPLYIDDTANIRLLDLRSRARRMVRKHGVKIIFIDYLGLISTDDKSVPKHEQMAEISMNIKALARELNIPIVALSQVGRQSEGRAPGLADLRGSGALEQDADTILYLYRDRHNEDPGQQPELIETELQIAKQRNGPVGSVKILFHPAYTRFFNPGHG